MSFWDNVKKFAQPYSEDEYDDYDEEDDYLEDYEEPAEAPARREKRRTPAPAPAPAEGPQAPPPRPRVEFDRDAITVPQNSNYTVIDKDKLILEVINRHTAD